MSRIDRRKPRWSRWLGAVANRALAGLASVVHRVGAPTLVGVPVSAVLLTRVAAVRPEQPLDEVAQLIVAGHHELLPVIDHGKPVAVISRQDVATGLEQVGPHATVSAAPSHHIVTATPTDSLAHVLEQLHAMPDAVAVIIDHGRPVGLLTEKALVAYLDAAGREEA